MLQLVHQFVSCLVCSMDLSKKFRGFNHRYQRVIQTVALAQSSSRFGAKEAEVLFQLLQVQVSNAKAIHELTGIPKSHLSRILAQLKEWQMIELGHSLTDRRMLHISLTEKGKAEAEAIAVRSNETIAALMQGLSVEEQHRLLENMESIQQLMNLN